jgi:hypothetical protein
MISGSFSGGGHKLFLQKTKAMQPALPLPLSPSLA